MRPSFAPVAPQFAAQAPRPATSPAGAAATGSAPGASNFVPFNAGIVPASGGGSSSAGSSWEPVVMPIGGRVQSETPYNGHGGPPGAAARVLIVHTGGTFMAFRLNDGSLVKYVSPPPSGTSKSGTSSSSRSQAVAADREVEPDARIALPGLVSDTAVGGGGRYLLLALLSVQKVGVFDVGEGKMKKYVNVDGDDFLIAGGATQFVVVDRTNHKMQAWKYDDLEKPAGEAKIAMTGRAQVLNVALGLAAEGPLAVAFAYTPKAMSSNQRTAVELFSLDTLTAIPGTGELFISTSNRNATELPMSITPDGTLLQVVRSTRCYRAFLSNGRVASLGDLQISQTYGDDPFMPHYDGKKFSSRYKLLPGDGTQITPDSPNNGGTGVISPALPSQYWLYSGLYARGTTAIGFHLAGLKTPIVMLRLKTWDDRVTPPMNARVLPDAKQFYYDGREKVLLVLSKAIPEILVKKFDVEKAAAEAPNSILHVVSEPPATFIPDQKYEYAIETISNRGGVTYRVESGPAGMIVSPQGRVEWKAPSDAPVLQTAIVVVGDKEGNQIFHNVKLKRGLAPIAEVTGIGVEAVVPNAGQVAVRLPAPADDFVVGAAGRYLLAPMASKRQIAVIDVKERKIAKLIPTDDDKVKVAAGMTRFVVYSGKGTISRWNFSKLEREVTLPYAKPVQSMCMGCASEGPLLIGEGEESSRKSVFLELSTLKPAKLQTWSSQYKREYDSMEDYCAASAGGQTFTTWREGSIPVGICSMVVRGDKVIINYRHDSAGPLTPSPDGSLVYTLRGTCDSRDREDMPNRSGQLRTRLELPAATGNYYLSWPKSTAEDEVAEVTLHAQGDSTPIVTIPGVTPPESPKKDASETDPLFSRRLLYVPLVDAVVTLGAGLDSVVIQSFSVDEALAKSKDDYLFVASTPPYEVRPATRLSYQLDVKSKKGGVKYELLAAPTGAAISPAGLLTWTIANSVSGSEKFVIRVTDAAAKETTHTFKINVDKTAPVFKPSALLAGATPKTGGAAAAPAGDAGAVAMAEPALVETVDLGRPRKEVPLPAAVERLCIGGGGRYLVGVIKSLRQVVVIDVQEAKILKLLPADDDNVLVAAGATKFVVWLGTKSIFSRYDLATCARELTTAGPVVKIRGMAMGCTSEGPLLLAVTGDFQPRPLIYDLKTLKASGIEFDKNASHDFGGELAVSGDGKFFVAGNAQCLINDKKVQLVSGDGYRSSSGFGLPSADGRIVYDSNCGMWTVGGSRIGEGRQNAFAVPAAVGSLYARLPYSEFANDSPYATLHVQGETAPILTMEEIELPKLSGGDSGGRMPLKINSERFFLLPTLQAVAVLADAADSLTIYRFNVDEELKKTDVDYLFVLSVPPAVVHPSASVQYQLDVRSKRGSVKYRLEAGPPGAAVSPTGLVSWSPKGPDPEEKVLIVAVGDASGQEIFHTFKLKVDAAAPNAPAVGISGPKLPPAGAAPPAAAQPVAAAPVAVPPATMPVAEPEPSVASAPGERAKHALKLPAAVDDVVVGGGGRYLVAQLKTLRQAAIIDVREKKVVKYLPVDDDKFFIAAGNTKLIIASASKQILSRYDLATGNRELTTVFSGKPIAGLALGSSSEGPLFVAQSEYVNWNGVFLDLQSLKPLALTNSGRGPLEFGNNVRVSADGSLFGSWRNGTSPSGLFLTTVTGKSTTSIYEHESVGRVMPGPDARMVYTGAGMFTPLGKPLAGEVNRGYSTAVMLPAASGPFYLSVAIPSSFGSGNRNEPQRLTLHMQGETSPILAIDDVEMPSAPGDMHPAHVAHLDFDKRLFLLPIVDALVCIPQTSDQLIIQRFNLDEELSKSDVDFLFAASVPPGVVKAGASLEYQIQGKSKRGGLKYRLESGPTGMAVSPTGLVTWKAVRGGESEEVAIVALSDNSGQEIFHTFKLRVDDGTSAAAPAVAVPPTTGPAATRPIPRGTAGLFPPPMPTGTATVPKPTPTSTAGVGVPVRTWHSSDGIFSIEAQFVKVAGNTVTLRRTDGKSIEVPLDKLDAEGQQFIKRQTAAGK
ncbi:MAG: hypothetical protein JNK76_06615 [Planctomycetales bacterium]|nr:hypothetical protein [Planctomycetales bacterium]